MIIQGINTNKNQQNYQQKKRSKISFKQVTPDHFFIKMNRFERNQTWGQFMVELVDSTKNRILNPETKFKKILYKMGAKYNRFHVNLKKSASLSAPDKSISAKYKIFKEKILASSDFGKKKHFYNSHIVGTSLPNHKFGEYFPLLSEIFKKNEDHFLTRKLLKIKGPKEKDKRIFKIRSFKVFQAQEKIENKNVILTQIGYEEPTSKSIRKNRISLIHPPTSSRKHILGEAQKAFESLKQYKGKDLSEENIAAIYEKVGKIHWCIAQSMPFIRGSAAIADAFTKSLFEAVNIQTSPWKRSLSPDMEAFAIPLEEYSKKYRSFFED